MTHNLTTGSRRTFLSQSLAGVAAAAILPSRIHAQPSAQDPARKGRAPREPSELAFDPWSKLKAISNRAHQLWPVIYLDKTNLLPTVERDVEAAFEGGADAVVLELGDDYRPLQQALEHVKNKYPRAKVGCDYLGGDADPYGYMTTFKLCKELNLDIAWTDFSGVDLIQELPEISLHAIEAARPANAFYCSGVHMKYGTLKDPNKTIEQSALQAMGWVEGVILTGPRTGVPSDPERPRRVRQVIGSYPMGLASGVSAENFPLFRDYVDFCLVNTSISDASHRILVEKVKELRRVMDA